MKICVGYIFHHKHPVHYISLTCARMYGYFIKTPCAESTCAVFVLLLAARSAVVVA